MDQDKTLGILQALAEGIDPYSGEAFAADSPYQHADTVRALYAAIAALRPAAKTAPAGRAAAGNAGKSWSQDEDARLLQAFDAGESLEALARAHGRSRLGIEARLAKFGRLPPPAKILPSARLEQLREAHTR